MAHPFEQWVREIDESRDSVRAEIAELRAALDARTVQLAALADRVELALDQENRRREMLLRARDRVLRAEEEMQAIVRNLQASLATTAGARSPDGELVLNKHIRYRRLIGRIRAVVRETLPVGATVLVVSKGDDELLELEGRQARHFPQTADGSYAGHYPANSRAAIEHLEALRARGASYLLLPGTSLWWLEYYAEFKEHLESHYKLVVNQADTCVIFALDEDE